MTQWAISPLEKLSLRVKSFAVASLHFDWVSVGCTDNPKSPQTCGPYRPLRDGWMGDLLYPKLATFENEARRNQDKKK